jgi:hypothetical protein
VRVLLSIAVVLLAGCPPTGTYLSARTPPAGTLTTGGVVRLAGGEPDVYPVPNVDLFGSWSPSDDVNLTGRLLLANLGVESTARWRFVHAGRVHLAIAPSAAVYIGSESRENADARTRPNLLARGNLFATIDTTDYDVNLAVFGGVSRLVRSEPPDPDRYPPSDFNYELQGTHGVVGAAVGLGIRLGSYEIRPSLEWQRYLADGAHREIGTFSLAWEH